MRPAWGCRGCFRGGSPHSPQKIGRLLAGGVKSSARGPAQRTGVSPRGLVAGFSLSERSERKPGGNCTVFYEVTLLSSQDPVRYRSVLFIVVGAKQGHEGGQSYRGSSGRQVTAVRAWPPTIHVPHRGKILSPFHKIAKVLASYSLCSKARISPPNPGRWTEEALRHSSCCVSLQVQFRCSSSPTDGL